MKYLPEHPCLKRHIDYFWIVKQGQELFKHAPPLLDFPGLCPELIYVLDGYYTIHYQGRKERVSENRLYSFVYQDVLLDCSTLKSFAIVRFKARNLSSLLPFIPCSAPEVMRNSICRIEDIFRNPLYCPTKYLSSLPAPVIGQELENWLLRQYRPEHEGFLADMAAELPDGGSPKEVMAKTGYSYSTLERHFKRDTGLGPKQYQRLQRFRRVINELYDSRNPDWMHYVVQNGYHDQSHLIREVKRYSRRTPATLLRESVLQDFRPH
ncbi:MAG: AraC family transcriptional regulator [Bacteroidota bacterium]